MNFLTFINGVKTFVSKIDFIDFTNGAFRIRLTGTSTTDRVIDLPNNSGTIALTSNLGTVAIQNASTINITGGSLTGVVIGSTANFNSSISRAMGVWSGVDDSSPRILFSSGEQATSWTIDNDAGIFRWFTPGITRMTLRASDTLLEVRGPISAKIYTPATRPGASTLPAGAQIVVFDPALSPSHFLAYTDTVSWHRVSGTTILP